LVLAAIGPGDTPKTVESMASKILKMKLWADDDGKMVGGMIRSNRTVSLILCIVEKECTRH
jgi:D-Tyr-tRNAtyr deacylase